MDKEKIPTCSNSALAYSRMVLSIGLILKQMSKITLTIKFFTLFGKVEGQEFCKRVKLPLPTIINKNYIPDEIP